MSRSTIISVERRRAKLASVAMRKCHDIHEVSMDVYGHLWPMVLMVLGPWETLASRFPDGSCLRDRLHDPTAANHSTAKVLMACDGDCFCLD